MTIALDVHSLKSAIYRDSTAFIFPPCTGMFLAPVSTQPDSPAEMISDALTDRFILLVTLCCLCQAALLALQLAWSRRIGDMGTLLSPEEVEALLYGLRDEPIAADEPILLRIELGRTHMPARELLQLSLGSVIDLPKPAEEPCEVWINHKLVAYGEVIATDDQYGVRITELLYPIEKNPRD